MAELQVVSKSLPWIIRINSYLSLLRLFLLSPQSLALSSLLFLLFQEWVLLIVALWSIFSYLPMAADRGAF